MNEQRRYDPQTAEDLFAELQDSYRQLPDYAQAYRWLNRVFQQCLNETTRFEGIRFSGPFAKTDFLLKENHAPRGLQRSVNQARVRLREWRQREPAELEANYLYDLKAVSQFVGLVFRLPVPGVLQAVFPADRLSQRGALKGESLRIIVNHWDDTYIYAQADAEGLDDVTVFYGGKSPHSVYADWDWSYLKDYLKEGCQMNLVRPREVNGVLYAELLIWEPDFLVDISAISNCFESYAVSPLLHLLAKLRPAANSQPIVLGNLAGQFLDECLQRYPDDSTYEESVQRFFRRNAISLLTAGLDADFHSQARRQKQNIHLTLRNTLPELMQGQGMHFDATEMMVEPSFFSEMLGLQGRMDFLQLGQKLLIEQKSGKARFPETDPPRAQEKHYVQLLLYMLLLRYNFRDTYERNGHKLFAFLLYSKYQNGLLPLGFAPDLMFAAIKVRNGIAAGEFSYSLGGLSILSNLTADALNLNHVRGPLWERYLKPQLDALLTPIHQATELERAYFLRFLRFIQTEHILSKVGTQTKENSGFADKWYSSLEDKLQAGNIYYDLDLVSPSAADTGTVDHLVLALTERTSSDISNFRVGDIVILYPYAEGEEPDARRTMVFRAYIEHIEANHIELSLRAQQVSAAVFWYQGCRRWAIEHDFLESSYASLYRGMHAFLLAPAHRRELLLLQREPQADTTRKLVGDYGTFNELALRARQATDLFLIIGPPGTGKTSFGLLNTLQEELASDADASVLLLSYTNRAVDEICSKLIESGIDFIRVGGRFSCHEDCRPFLLESRAEHCVRLDQLQALIARTRVFVGTTTTFNANIHLFQLKQFSLAIIDEASQILEPHLIGLLSATTAEGTPAIRKFIMIGDHKQLPAVVLQSQQESAVSEPLLQDIGLIDCRLSLFERLLRRYRHDPAVTYMLTRQGRMHHDIALFPNEAFYQGRLTEVPLPHQLEPLPPAERPAAVPGASPSETISLVLRTRRVAFVPVVPEGPSASDKVNTAEAQVIAATIASIYDQTRDHFDPQQTVGVIVPYRNQIAEVRNCLERYDNPLLRQVTIDTVERFQGSQRDYIIYGFTVQRHYQLAFLTENMFEEDGCIVDRKLNVAMTRARLHLLLVGNPQLLCQVPTFARLIESLKPLSGLTPNPSPTGEGSI